MLYRYFIYSTFIRSTCCNAQLVAWDDMPMDVMYVHCTNCGRIVGLPYGEDLHDLDYGKIPNPHISEIDKTLDLQQH